MIFCKKMMFEINKYYRILLVILVSSMSLIVSCQSDNVSWSVDKNSPTSTTNTSTTNTSTTNTSTTSTTSTTNTANTTNTSTINTSTIIPITFKEVAIGRDHTLGLTDSGDLYAWGDNSDGQLGDGSNNISLVPKKIGSGYKYISAGAQTSFAITTTGALYAWGYNLFKQLGDGTDINRNTPVLIGNGYKYVFAGALHGCAIKENGALYGWGDNTAGRVGTGSSDPSVPIPTQIGNDTDYTTLALGSHTLALKSNGDLYAWGGNNQGQLGDGTTTNKSTPIMIGNGYAKIAAGGSGFSIALKTDGTCYAFGNNDSGQLGLGNTTNQLTPQLISLGSKIGKAAFAGTSTSYVLTTDGTLYAFGSADDVGDLGNKQDSGQQNSPVQIMTGLTGNVKISTGVRSVLLINNAGAVYGWGDNSSGQLGDRTTTNKNEPTQITIYK